MADFHASEHECTYGLVIHLVSSTLALLILAMVLVMTGAIT